MRRGSACRSVRPRLGSKGSSLTRSQLEHREDRVRNRYIRFCTCLVFATVSALSSLAQSSDGVRSEQLLQQKVDGPGAALLTASLEGPPMGKVNDESELP